ncbi:putative C6 transcription factor [Colletotrichum sublineola]|uniref:Uncharacterized protein n=1 Tax=Colletotrichum sublineola TaxID=1173701 RepID=A0A066XHL5_COLSU|nr:putative C6 transcription factor [Colletotrichum sublineola]KDN65525.1 hypothetical protein CSUB01_01087 [Colletotrichum sublineola]
MGRRKAGKAVKPATSSAYTQLTTSGVRDDPILGYKIRVLLYDLRNLSNEPSSERRLNATTDEHYISAPYFQQEEAVLIKTALVDIDLDDRLDPSTIDYMDDLQATNARSPVSLSSRLRNQPLDAAIRMMLGNFLEKRRASGDWRPCGPHHLAPIYAALFGLDVAELKDDKFLSRLRRAGI